MNTVTGMLLCAGLGTRLRPHTERIAKPALPVLNIPMLCFPLYYFEQAGLKKLVVNTHHRSESVRLAVKTHTRGQHYTLEFSHEAPNILGSGGALLQAQSYLQGQDFLLANGDSVTLFRDHFIIQKLLSKHRQSKSLATLMITPHPEAGKTLSAVWMNGQGDITGFGLTPPVEQPDSQAFHFLGFQVISQDVFKGIPSGVSNIFYDVFVKALRDGQKISSYLVEDVVWNETGNEVDYLRAHADLLEKLATHSHYAEPIRSLLDRFSPGWGAVQPRAGVFLHRDSHLTSGDFPPRALISANCRLHPEAQFSKSGFVVLGESCEVREPCLLENVVLATGAITDQKGYLSQTLVTGTSLETQH